MKNIGLLSLLYVLSLQSSLAQNGNVVYNNGQVNRGVINAMESVAVGFNAGKGISALRSQENTFIGYQSGAVAIGPFENRNEDTGYNTFVGAFSGQFLGMGNHNVLMGRATGEHIGDSNQNTYLGAFSARNITEGNNNVFVGAKTGYNTQTGSNNIFIGYEAGFNENNLSHKLIIANSRNNTLISGDFSTHRIGIYTASPDNTLDVNGGIDMNSYIRHNGNENTYFGFPANNEFYIVTNGSARLRVKANGFVGLNTSSPTERLHVNGAIRIGNSSSNNPGTLRWNGTDFQGHDGTGWRSLTVPASLWSFSDGNALYNEAGNVGIGLGDNPTRAKLEVLGDVIFASNYLQNGNELRGQHMRWDSQKFAFRTGNPDGNAWDTQNRGLYSFASGRGTLASGEYSTAFGVRSQATGFVASAFGYESEASGKYALAFGERNKAESYGSVVFGRYNLTQDSDPDEERLYSANTWEAKDILLAVGNGTDNDHRRNALSLYKDGSMELKGEYNFNGEPLANTYFWNANRGSIRLNALEGVEEATPGYGSMAIGRGVDARGFYSAAFGNHVSAESFSSLVIGSYNELGAFNHGTWENEDPLFVVGNGTNEENRSNALTLLKNGKLGLGIAPIGNYILETNGHINARGNLYANSVQVLSDARFKIDVEEIENGNDLLRQLRPVSYLFNRAAYPEHNFDEHRHIGFIANEVKEIIPELIREDENGMLSMNYTGLIPLVTKAAQEMAEEIGVLKEEKEVMKNQISALEEEDERHQNRINDLEEENESLHDQLSELMERVRVLEGDKYKFSRGTLQQNAPNPFSASTRINYFLPENTQNASIYIFDLNGKMKKEFKLEGKKDGSVTLESRSLEAGVYVYSLVINGKEIDSKRMILTR